MAPNDSGMSRENLVRGEANDTPAMSVTEAGRKGGRTTAARRGPDFYREIGRKGGVATAEAHGPAFYSAIGRKGGEARADDLDMRSGALGRKGALARWGDGVEPNGESAQDGPNGDNVAPGVTNSSTAHTGANGRGSHLA